MDSQIVGPVGHVQKARDLLLQLLRRAEVLLPLSLTRGLLLLPLALNGLRPRPGHLKLASQLVAFPLRRFERRHQPFAVPLHPDARRALVLERSLELASLRRALAPLLTAHGDLRLHSLSHTQPLPFGFGEHTLRALQLTPHLVQLTLLLALGLLRQSFGALGLGTRRRKLGLQIGALGGAAIQLGLQIGHARLSARLRRGAAATSRIEQKA